MDKKENCQECSAWAWTPEMPPYKNGHHPRCSQYKKESSLLPCPFCGRTGWRNREDGWIECHCCHAAQPDKEQWNTRTPDPAIQKVVDAAIDFRNQMRVQSRECLPLPAEYDTLVQAISELKKGE